ncbi:tetratricopeptide repeat protein [Tepidibacter formicigenes]|jgi:tetratricopeptide (TPR) repeat protein|uniref:Tetratricopeptide repeat-containing protein n=1 Tax=Tepidibacter formicigenes DSM 15518 TaxID=1123349 RepID=A0A1M6KS87_9FIRM|nr:tetratricopeptide repeat protein [Tepidibacter formicigenes]SHJ61838.1 Tetratricopeptide repeat-containing protein [Tepidibacter formicigenes DSM 15518]
MKFRIENYIFNKTENIAFLTIKEDADLHLKGYKIPKGGIDVPILNEELVKGIKERSAENNLTLVSIANGMIYIIGIDSKFKYNEEYKKFLYEFDEKIEDYIGYMGVKKANEKELTEALIYFKSLITLNPNNVNGLYNYALVCQDIAKIHEKNKEEKKMNDFLLEALDKLETIIDIYPEFTLAYYQLGYHYYNQKQYIKAKLTWEEAIELGLDEDREMELKNELKKMEHKVDYEEGYNLVLRGQAEEGLEKLLPLMDEYSDWWNLLFFIGLAYRQLNNVDEAIKYFEKILILNPRQVDTIVEIGLCYAMVGNLKDSVEQFKRALDIKEDPEVMCNLGMAYLQMGDIDEAKKHIEKAYSLNPEDEVTIACINELKKYEK